MKAERKKKVFYLPVQLIEFSFSLRQVKSTLLIK